MRGSLLAEASARGLNKLEQDAISRTSMKDRIVDRLRRMIVFGELPPGTRLSEQELSRLFKVSKTPIREAMAVLKGERLLTGESWQGIYVVRLTRKDIGDLYSIRVLLEPEAVRQATIALDDAGRRRLVEFRDQFNKLQNADDMNAYIVLDSEFHSFIFETTGNPWLIDILSRTTNMTTMVRAATTQELSAEEHIPIIEAMLSGDAGKASELMKQHVMNAWTRAVRSCGSRNVEGTEAKQ